jgi:hypothetical protein
MNILVLSENFLEGGLEKHIEEFANQGTKRDDEFFFFFAKQKEPLPAIIEKGLEGALLFPLEETPDNLVRDVSAIVNAIERHNIDIVQVHPFRVYLPAVIAAQYTRTPLVFTFHGPLSYTFPSSPTQAALFQHFLANSVSAIFTVNKKFFHSLNAYFPDTRIIHMPNPISRTAERHTNYRKGHWCLASRLDSDKVDGLKRFFEWLPELPITELDVYGSGNCEDSLKLFVSKLNLTQKINWKGYAENWLKKSSQCEGVIGLGRVVLESAIGGFPVILLTYNAKPCGVLNDHRYEESALCNFNGSALDQLESPQELAKEISATVADEEKLSTLRTRIEADYSAKSVYETYSSVLENALFRPCPEYTAFFNEVKLTINSGDPATIITHSMAATMARHFTNPLVFNTFLQSYTEAGQQRNVLALQTSLNASTAKLASYEQEVHTLTDAFQSLDRHHSSALYAINGRMIDLNDRIDKLFKSNADLKRRLTSLEKTIEKKNHQIAALQTSNSWRIGRFVTYLPRRIKRLIKQFVK